MTEEEAKTKWCPFARVVGMEGSKVLFHQAAFNRGTSGSSIDTPVAANCIGSACMAWRWRQVPIHETSDVRIDSKTEGRCGLAGKS